ncbi:TetR/AcrR family transcriptional regulator [Qipengyuania soli]|uniref:TetR/AcrR family transcriptional regulator n=1 Tax=Qipengyuania soli TaxID=2782568 RepID=UPI002483B29D|nr:TetR/AcrR family transcriptional regulator [Qipengyuania soli]
MPRQQERSETTRNAICAVFRKSLLERGLEATTTLSVLAEAGLSKGALYHHFASKAEIVETIYREESHAAVKRAATSVSGDLPPVERLKLACSAWLNELNEPDVARILLQIGPAALGSSKVREIEDELTLRLFQALLEEAMELGQVSLSDPLLAARLINGMVAEVAVLPRSDRKAAAGTIGPVVDAILTSLG